jgi:hypothetical protein
MVDSPGGGFWASWQDYVEKHLLDRRLISPNDLHLYKITDDINVAAREVMHFYSNYHSIRFVDNEMVMRLHRKPTPEQIERIHKDFGDICSSGGYRVSDALPIEKDEIALAALPRLIFQFNRRDHGRLRMLIDFLNDLP